MTSLKETRLSIYRLKDNYLRFYLKYIYLTQTKLNTLIACEIRFSKNPIKKTVIPEMRQKLSRLNITHGFACIPVLIFVGGIDDSVIDSDYFWKLINFADYLQSK